MSKIFLIHGSMVGVPAFYKTNKALKQQLKDGMFTIFRTNIQNNDPDYFLFKWMTNHDPKEKLNPAADLNSYYIEKTMILSPILQSKLNDHILEQQPTVIVSHSMGCELLLNTINQFGLADSVTTIITINSDSDNTKTITNSVIVDKLKTQKIKWINLHSKTDITLITSVLLNNMVSRAGLNGYITSLANNVNIDIFGNHNKSLTMQSVKEIILDCL